MKMTMLKKNHPRFNIGRHEHLHAHVVCADLRAFLRHQDQ